MIRNSLPHFAHRVRSVCATDRSSRRLRAPVNLRNCSLERLRLVATSPAWLGLASMSYRTVIAHTSSGTRGVNHGSPFKERVDVFNAQQLTSIARILRGEPEALQDSAGQQTGLPPPHTSPPSAIESSHPPIALTPISVWWLTPVSATARRRIFSTSR